MSAAGTGVSSGRRGARSDPVYALKFLAMAMVVMTHVLNLRTEFDGLAPGLVRAMVSFNMPLFAFLSGWVLVGREGRDPIAFLRKKATGLLVPYVAWIAVELPLRDVPPAGWLPRLGQALVDPHAGMQMWFLPVLFWLFVAFTVLRSMGGSDVLLASMAVACLAWSPYAPDFMGLDKVAWLGPFLLAGYLASRHRGAWRRFEGALAIGGAVAFAVLSYSGVDGLLPAVASAFAGIMAVAGAYRMLPDVWSALQAPAGRRSMGLYGLQMVLLPFLTVGSGRAGALATWALVLAASIAATYLIERVPLAAVVFLGSRTRIRVPVLSEA